MHCVFLTYIDIYTYLYIYHTIHLGEQQAILQNPLQFFRVIFGPKFVVGASSKLPSCFAQQTYRWDQVMLRCR